MTDPLFDEWRAYEKMVEHDYMYHASFFDRLESTLRQHFPQPFSFLDVGCGDASPILPILQKLNISRYCGLDKSETALSMAEARLSSLEIPCCFYPGDLQDTLLTVGGSFDLVMASFSLHHLETPEAKEQALRACRQLLNPGGLTVVIDIFRSVAESRQDYVDRWVDFARNNYLALNEPEITTLVDHVRNRDFPETLSTYESMGHAAGFRRFDILMADKEELNHLVILSP